MRATWASIVLFGVIPGVISSACAGEAPINAPSDAADSSATGLVTEPQLGAIVPGDPASISIRVAGTYADSTRALAVQVLADPDDLASWTTIATTQATTPMGDTFAFAIDIQPSATEPSRWPAGGVLRLRVIDDAGAALAIDPDDPTNTIVAIQNPGTKPLGWTYLSENPAGSIDETIAYYAATDAPATLADFMTRFGFPGDETTALYYNAGDLGIGREMHCRAVQVPAGGMAATSERSVATATRRSRSRSPVARRSPRSRWSTPHRSPRRTR
jgi:hypothetical protein